MSAFDDILGRGEYEEVGGRTAELVLLGTSLIKISNKVALFVVVLSYFLFLPSIFFDRNKAVDLQERPPGSCT
jgi:hypothetical protein